MKRAKVFFQNIPAGILEERILGKEYIFRYFSDYQGPPISLTMPVEKKNFFYSTFPPFFEGVLPEGMQLDGLLRLRKIDKNDLFSQLVAVGSDLVGAVTVEEIE
ncbi:MAG: HipA N-terminal domain-containing protein [bacterium]